MQPSAKVKGLLALVSAVLYGASPLDLIPDILPLIGIVDDAVIVTLLLAVGIMQLRRKEKVPAKAPVSGRIIPPPRQ